MIELVNGTINIKNKEYIIRPKQTVQDFLSSDLYCEVIDQQLHIFSNYYIKPQVIEGQKFIMRLFFNKSKVIDSVKIGIIDDDKIPTWNTWSEDNELERKSKHDKWLRKVLGPPPYRYDWGEITSNYDPRSGSSMITIRYFNTEN